MFVDVHLKLQAQDPELYSGYLIYESDRFFVVPLRLIHSDAMVGAGKSSGRATHRQQSDTLGQQSGDYFVLCPFRARKKQLEQYVQCLTIPLGINAIAKHAI